MGDWKRHGRIEVRGTKYPGIFEVKSGGWFARARLKDPRTGYQVEICQQLEAADAASASAWLEVEKRKIREGVPTEKPKRERFSEYAARFVERHTKRGELRSAKTRERWAYTLEHHLLPALGAYFVDAIDKALIEDQIGKWADAIVPDWMEQRRKPQPALKRPRKNARPPAEPRSRKPRKYSPNTINGWLSILRVILAAAAEELQLPRDPMALVKDLDTSTHRTYTEEEPNSLRPEDAPRFVAEIKRRYPQHYAMVALGLATGLRPSSMRALRRRGPTPDVLWDTGEILVRRSVTLGEAMERTKTAKDQRLALPPALVQVLRRHTMQYQEEKQRESFLLFPSETGGFRSASVLDKPFREVSRAIGLTYKVTPRAMRRTFDDLARRANIRYVVAKAVAGWSTGRMHEHYATVGSDEMRASLAKVIKLAGVAGGRRAG